MATNKHHITIKHYTMATIKHYITMATNKIHITIKHYITMATNKHHKYHGNQ